MLIMIVCIFATKLGILMMGYCRHRGKRSAILPLIVIKELDPSLGQYHTVEFFLSSLEMSEVPHFVILQIPYMCQLYCLKTAATSHN